MRRRITQHLDVWTIGSVIIAGIILLSLWQIIAYTWHAPTPTWLIIRKHVLPDVITNTFMLITLTALLSATLGITMAWFISMYEFPFRKWFKWTLVLPLALPAFIAGYIYADMLSYTGVIQRFFRITLDLNLPQNVYRIMTLEGAAVLFALTLYPYVYLATLAYLERQPASLFESARTLGHSQTSIFFRIALPLLRPAFVGGTLLVILEVLNDYGLVSYFGVRVFSTAIFTAWFNSGDVIAAIKLSGYLLLFVFVVLVVEKQLRGRKSRSHANTALKPIKRLTLSKKKQSLILLYLSTILFFAFIFPVIQLVVWAFHTYQVTLTPSLLYPTLNALSIAFFATAIIIALAIIIANFSRQHKTMSGQALTRLTTLGYSIPGAVIAIAVIMLFTRLDRQLAGLYQWLNPGGTVLFLTTSIAMLAFAYVLRFMAIGVNMIDSGYEKIGQKFTLASHTLGKGKFQTFIKVDFPMLLPAMISAFVIVFVDIMKELPLTLILRPFNYDTLATRVYVYANDEMVQEASIPALMIIILCTIAIYGVTHMRGGKKRGRHHA